MAGASLPCLGCSLSLRTAAAASGLPISARSRTRSVNSVAQDTNCMVLPTPPPLPPPPPPFCPPWLRRLREAAAAESARNPAPAANF